MKRVLAPGFFDGVHIGHGKLFKAAAAQAERIGARACALTYDAHPTSVLTGRPIPLLCSAEERAALIQSLHGVPEVIMEPFDQETAAIPWRDYIDDVLIGRLEAAFIVAGHDYTFGRGGEGTPERLREHCAARGVGCAVIPPERIGGTRVSSTYIRGLIAEGDMERAARFLGRRYRLSGVVERGRGLGRRLGFPTVNLPLPPGRQAPEWGVYATVIVWDGREYPAVTNVGVRPSVEDGGAPTIESTLLSFDGDLYGEPIGVEFARFIRPEIKFPSADALAGQIRRDAEAARAILNVK
ncbi:MAG: riboflavin biosynthesis protein RibF [Oscillospiraceae bacterium]|nr:riboflavin biosynthesis protein RibF [Oscillospiraceae bacterium]